MEVVSVLCGPLAPKTPFNLLVDKCVGDSSDFQRLCGPSLVCHTSVPKLPITKAQDKEKTNVGEAKTDYSFIYIVLGFVAPIVTSLLAILGALVNKQAVPPLKPIKAIQANKGNASLTLGLSPDPQKSDSDSD